MPAGSYRFRIGSIACTVLSDGYSSYPASWIFPDVDPDRLARSLDRHRLPHDSVLSPYTCLLIETGRHVVLIDTGGGSASQSTGAILARLDIEGIRPSDVDTVVLTHAHPDHIGGALDSRGRPVFAAARHLIALEEWEFWMHGRSNLDAMRAPEEYKHFIRTAARRSLHALRHHLETVDGETEIVPGVRTVPAPGHSPGHLAILVASDGELLLNLGDAAMHPLHLEEPEWETGLDLAGGAAVQTRRALAARAASEKMRVMAFHFPFPSVGRLEPRAGHGWNWNVGQ